MKQLLSTLFVLAVVGAPMFAVNAHPGPHRHPHILPPPPPPPIVPPHPPVPPPPPIVPPRPPVPPPPAPDRVNIGEIYISDDASNNVAYLGDCGPGRKNKAVRALIFKGGPRFTVAIRKITVSGTRLNGRVFLETIDVPEGVHELAPLADSKVFDLRGRSRKCVEKVEMVGETISIFNGDAGELLKIDGLF